MYFFDIKFFVERDPAVGFFIFFKEKSENWKKIAVAKKPPNLKISITRQKFCFSLYFEWKKKVYLYTRFIYGDILEQLSRKKASSPGKFCIFRILVEKFVLFELRFEFFIKFYIDCIVRIYFYLFFLFCSREISKCKSLRKKPYFRQIEIKTYLQRSVRYPPFHPGYMS